MFKYRNPLLRVGRSIKFRQSRVLATASFNAKRTRFPIYAVFAGVSLVLLSSPATNDVDLKKKGISVEDVEKHNNLKTGVWVVINGQVYDLTSFITLHPGGAKIILKYAGKNASAIFNKYHAKDVFEKFLSKDAHLGPLIGEMEEAEDITAGQEDDGRAERIANKPSISKVFNISDFEYISKEILTDNAWAYYSSAADDEITLRENHYAYQRIFFNPKVLVKTGDVDISTEMLGTKTEAPFYCSAAAQARLGHEDGELSIARGCGKEGIIQMISSSASYTLDEIIEAGVGPQWFQLYVMPDRTITNKTIEKVTKAGLKGLFVTVDTPLIGNREKDRRLRLFDDGDDEDEEAEIDSDFVKQNDPILSFKDPGITWEDIKLFKQLTNMPVVIKGVQRVEDVLLAVEHNVDGVVLSNHGGRQLDFARSPVEVLADVMPVLREKKIDDKIEVYVDGGIRRGTDVLKALCLGAKGVGLGRPFLYANSCYGEKGVEKAIQILKEEISLNMKLLGVSKVSELDSSLLDLRNLHSRPYYSDSAYNRGYDPIASPKFKDE